MTTSSTFINLFYQSLIGPSQPAETLKARMRTEVPFERRGSFLRRMWTKNLYNLYGATVRQIEDAA